jgi:hypothetical protein
VPIATACSTTAMVKGTCPTIGTDIEDIVRGVRVRLPEATCEQLSVSHAADDDGLWFFSLPGSDREVQIESSTGRCPFLVETNGSDERVTASSVSEVVDCVVRLLQRGPT